ncbi:thiamine ABC transporter substrate-binding protein [Actinomyces succiniciruminis]|uniref:ABC transporter, substrate-binding protein, thiB n=1 Tax=Actinomyces succiniciruminis TaxID=1522002 RepID=A0A1L7RMN6_9ACTO|nr:thiamine ABC transporter substrate-binding protein [Actinomyces succiniciruminis]CED90738.1 ABC transporter, substrate-binding protein, thiB [Actinomyces succiniciruminis]
MNTNQIDGAASTRSARSLATIRPSRRALLAGGAATAVGLALAACGSGNNGAGDTAAGGDTVTVVTYDSFDLPDELITAFKDDTGYTLEIARSGDGGEVANKLILTKDAPLGDAVFGINNTMASRILAEGVIDTTTALNLPDGAADYLAPYIVDDTPALVPIDFGEVCVNVDTFWLSDRGLEIPTVFEDLTDPVYKDMFVAINPTTSSTGMAFLLATIGHFGEDGFAQYWKDLVANGTKIDEGWSDAYYTDFTAGGGDGAYPIVVSYSSSPAATLNDDGIPTTAAMSRTATRQVEYAGVLAGAANPDGAAAFVAWMLSRQVQEAIPDAMYMYPVDPDAALADDLADFGATAEDPIVVDPADIADHQQEWLTAWAEAVGQ